VNVNFDRLAAAGQLETAQDCGGFPTTTS
jgi:hypothetical protein